jgi:hypothetical protein
VTTEPQAGYPEQSQAVTILVLGILSIVICQILGPFAWKMGHEELKAITEGRRSPEGQGMAQAGKICGIVGTVLLGLAIIILILVFLVLIPVGIVTSSEFGGFDFTP